MIDTLPPPQVEPRASSRTPESNSKRAGATVGILAACVVLAILCIYLAARVHSQNSALADLRTQLNLTNFRADQTQSTLDAARSQASALQEQLVSDQGARSGLQAQVDQVKAQSAVLQAQLVSDEGQRMSLKAQLAQANAESSALQAQLVSDRGLRSDLQSQLDQAKSQAAGMQTQIAKDQSDLARLQPLIAQARQLPLSTSFEKSFWDQGFTLHITNPGTSALRLGITVTGEGKTRAQLAVIEGGATLNVPRLPAGESVTIVSDGFDPLKLTAR